MSVSLTVRDLRALSLSQSHPRRTSFTLIEVLLALSLTALLVAVTGRIAVQAVTTRQSVGNTIVRLEREAGLFERLGADFAAILYVLPSEDPSLMVYGHPRQVLQLSALSPVPSLDESLHLVRRPATVRYRLVEDPHTDKELNLVRETIDLTGQSARPVSETVASQIAGFDVEVLCDDQWTDKYPPRTRRPAPARAVRITCRWSDSEKPVTRTFTLRHAH